jgi:hypothetical protein
MSGWANRRCFTGVLACAAWSAGAAARSGAEPPSDSAGWRPAEAGAVGFGSCRLWFALSARAARFRSLRSSFGTG